MTNDTLFARYLAENIACHDYEKRKYEEEKDEEYLKFFNSALKDENYEAVKFLISFMPSCASKPKSQKQISEKLFQATESQDKRTLLISPQERVKELLKKNEFDQLTKYLLHSENLKISSR